MSLVIDERSLRSLRQARGWDQKTLATKAGVTPPVVSRLERGLQGDVNASVLVALARTLDVSVDALLVPYRSLSGVELEHELAVVVDELSGLSQEHQRLVTGILWGFLSAASHDPTRNDGTTLTRED